MRCQEVVSVWDKNIKSWISEVKQYEETIANEQSQNGRGEYQIDETTFATGGYSKCEHMRTREKGVEKSVIRYVHTEWMASNKCCGIFFVHWPSQVQ